mmetsp:Transcript_44528/g.49916  ORF Transcript_44528/g.49916 Transcript_44528/m.49916 type:complete len:454 (-) Transcript_44528:1020-2381(-)
MRQVIIGNNNRTRTISMLKVIAVASSMTIQSPRNLLPYKAPSFARHLKNVPKYRIKLANLPTPLQNIIIPNSGCRSSSTDNNNDDSGGVLQPLRDLNIQLIIKRDDMTAGTELGGNKVRKLEFLLADALDGGYDSVVTIGGEQSNHCRATATACRMIGLEPHLILRTRRATEVESNKDEDSFGYVGNILFDRMVGAKIHTCTPGEYGRAGSHTLVQSLCEDLESCIGVEKQKKVYQIPVGGSNGLGTWGYIEAVEEFMHQFDSDDVKIDHVVFACGSGGTAAGITLGLILAYREDNNISNVPNIHAIGVCDYPDYFYDTISAIAKEMGLDVPSILPTSETVTTRDSSLDVFIRDHLIVHQGKGKGYALSSEEELNFIVQFAVETGICLDPVYSGKALFQFIEEVKKDPESYRDSRIVFWHTGGSLGNFEKVEALSANLRSVSQVERMDVYGNK